MTTEAEKVLVEYQKNKESLNAREQDVLERYYGLDEQTRHSLSEIGTIYGVTRERIRQIKVSALTKLGIK